MTDMPDIYIVSGVRTAIGDFGGSLKSLLPTELEKRGLKPLAKIIAWGHAGVEPEYMGEGPIVAVPIALQRAGMTLAQMDVIEANEAFAAQALAVAKVLGFDREKLNPSGSGVALGHPVGATGCILR